MKFYLLILPIALPLLLLADTVLLDYRLWKATNGEVIYAKLSRVEDNQLEFEKENGEKYKVPFSGIDKKEFWYINRHLRERGKDTIELPSYTISDSHRSLIPSTNQSNFGRGSNNKTCGPNACINYLLWWQDLGLIQPPKSESTTEVCDYLHTKLARWMSSWNGTDIREIQKGLDKYFDQYPIKYYDIEMSLFPFSIEEAARQCTASNMVILSLQTTRNNRKHEGHWVSLIRCDDDGIFQINTWGKRFYGRIVPGVFKGKEVHNIECIEDPGNSFAVDEEIGFIIEEGDSLLVAKLTPK
jgi:hypothetical protein